MNEKERRDTKIGSFEQLRGDLIASPTKEEHTLVMFSTKER